MFYYNPTAGNLLFDIRIAQGNTNTNIEARLDAWDRTNDSVSRVWSGDVNASTGLLQTIGLATELFFWPNPKLSATLQFDSVVLNWPANPDFFLLQREADLGSRSLWQLVTNGILKSNALKTLALPLDGTAGYFRLVSQPP